MIFGVQGRMDFAIFMYVTLAHSYWVIGIAGFSPSPLPVGSMHNPGRCSSSPGCRGWSGWNRVGRGLLGVWPIGMQPSGLPAATGVQLCGPGGLCHGLALNEVLRLERSSGLPPSGASPPWHPSRPLPWQGSWH